MLDSLLLEQREFASKLHLYPRKQSRVAYKNFRFTKNQPSAFDIQMLSNQRFKF